VASYPKIICLTFKRICLPQHKQRERAPLHLPLAARSGEVIVAIKCMKAGMNAKKG